MSSDVSLIPSTFLRAEAPPLHGHFTPFVVYCWFNERVQGTNLKRLVYLDTVSCVATEVACRSRSLATLNRPFAGGWIVIFSTDNVSGQSDPKTALSETPNLLTTRGQVRNYAGRRKHIPAQRSARPYAPRRSPGFGAEDVDILITEVWHRSLQLGDR